MKKLLYLASMFIGFGFLSCSKDASIAEDKDKANESVLMTAATEYPNMYNLLYKLGFSNAASVDITTETEIMSKISTEGVNLSPYNVSDAVKLTFLDESGGIETGYVLLGKNETGDCDKFLSVKLELGSGNLQYVIGTFNNDANGNPLSVNTETHNIFGASGIEIITLGEENLGPRRKNESFNDCFRRNWANFATDIPSALSQAIYPHLIAAAISITCAPSYKEKAPPSSN